MYTAKVQTLTLRDRFSTAVEFWKANCREVRLIPSVKRPKKPALGGLVNPTDRYEQGLQRNRYDPVYIDRFSLLTRGVSFKYTDEQGCAALGKPTLK